jgi:hypothetical protein
MSVAPRFTVFLRPLRVKVAAGSQCGDRCSIALPGRTGRILVNVEPVKARRQAGEFG